MHGAVVLTDASGYIGSDAGIHVLGIDAVDSLAHQLNVHDAQAIVVPGRSLASDAYRPLPSLIESARSLFEHGDLPRIHRAAAATEPALQSHLRDHPRGGTNSDATPDPADGRPGIGQDARRPSGCTLQVARRSGGRSRRTASRLPRPCSCPGNGPLVEVLQYELKGAGGGGKAFVRGVKEYVKTYSRSHRLVPPEHVLIFDEAQRSV